MRSFCLFTEFCNACAGSIPYPELLAYAQSLSSFTSAPPNMPDRNVPGPPPPLFFPPFPNEEKMRRGHLNAEAPLGLPGETHSVRGTPTATVQQVIHRDTNIFSLQLQQCRPKVRTPTSAWGPEPIHTDRIFARLSLNSSISTWISIQIYRRSLSHLKFISMIDHFHIEIARRTRPRPPSSFGYPW